MLRISYKARTDERKRVQKNFFNKKKANRLSLRLEKVKMSMDDSN